MKTAQLLEIPARNDEGKVKWFGDARVYRLSEPLVSRWTEAAPSFVIVSAASNETYIFPADSHGQLTDWCELEGSFQGFHDHERALRNAGYEVVR